MAPKVSRSRSKRSRERSRSGSRSSKTDFRFSAQSVFAGLLLWISVIALIHGGKTAKHTELAIGQRSPSTVVAAFDFECLDVAKTELARLQATESVLPVFSINYTPMNNFIRSLDGLQDDIRAYRQEIASEKAGGSVLIPLPNPADFGLRLTPEEAMSLFPETREKPVFNFIRAALSTVWAKGIISPDERASSFGKVARHGNISIQDPDLGETYPASLRGLLLPGDTLASIMNSLTPKLSDIPSGDVLLKKALSPVIEPNLIYETALTEFSRQEALKQVEPVTITVRSGTTLVEAQERVTADVLEKLSAHSNRSLDRTSSLDRIVQASGDGVALFLILLICGAMLRMFAPTVAARDSSVLILASLALICLVPIKGILFVSGTTRYIPPALLEFLLPIAVAPMLATVLLSSSAAFALGAFVSFGAAIMFDNSFTVLMLGLVVTVVSIHSMRIVHKRSGIFRAGVCIGLAHVLVGVSVVLWNQHTPAFAVKLLFWGMITGLTCALLTFLLIPIFEFIFSRTTDIRLLELSDMEHPLLKRLAMEAPGTYHHSLMVANISQAAATEIGANALLARVSAYYHDIGKLTKPAIFVENQQHGGNLHDELAPTMSTLLIIAHVKEGVSLALQHKLPRPIIEGIQQHHGTSVISYFFHRAKQSHQETQGADKVSQRNSEVSEEDFRYPGPKPKKPEMGILHLADSVEAASRAMEKPTPAKISTLVNEIFNDRIRDGQLDECQLTLAQLKAIKTSMIFTLTNMLHGRIPYPGDENRSDQQTEKSPNSGDEHSKLIPMADAAGSRA